MQNSEHVIDLIPAYVLDCLDRDEAAQVAEHLAHCGACQAELVSYRAVVDRLSMAVPEVEPPPDLKGRLLHRVRREAVDTARPQSRRLGWPAFITRAAPVWAVASVVLLLLLGVSTAVLWQQVSANRHLAHVSSMPVIALQGAGSAPQAHGVIVMSADGKFGTLVVDELAPLDAAHQYQLWLIEANGQRVSGGVFSVDNGGYGALVVWSKQPLSTFPGFGVTIEPAGGSPRPTGENVLGTSL